MSKPRLTVIVDGETLVDTEVGEGWTLVADHYPQELWTNPGEMAARIDVGLRGKITFEVDFTSEGQRLIDGVRHNVRDVPPQA